MSPDPTKPNDPSIQRVSPASPDVFSITGAVTPIRRGQVKFTIFDH